MKVLTIFATMLLAASTVFGAGSNDILGLWKTEKGDVHLEFFGCGETICGKIVWLDEPKYVNEIDGPVGIAKFDRKNPDPTLMNRLILGLQVMKGVTYLGKNKWGGGVCYDPQSGNTYKCKMKLVSPDRLEMRGYIGISLFGRNYVLIR
jgi:uncharacterized protein (DUF2147 family)